MQPIDDVAMNIRNERRGEIDRNPSIECEECENSYNYQDYWESRYVKGKEWNPAAVYWICDNCLEQMYAWHERRVKERQHKALTEWSE